jgi:DNA-binding beta-propeller fold protein YncE
MTHLGGRVLAVVCLTVLMPVGCSGDRLAPRQDGPGRGPAGAGRSAGAASSARAADPASGRAAGVGPPAVVRRRGDPPGQLLGGLRRWRSGPNPKQVGFTPDGRQLWVTLLGGHGVEIFDPASGRRRAQIRLGRHGAVEVIFTRDGRTAYASQMETASVFEIDTATRKVRRQLHTGGTWTKVLALSPDERTLYAANWVSSDVSVIDLRRGTLRRRLPTVRTPRGLYPTRDGRRLYVAGFEGGEIEDIDLASGHRRMLLRTGGAMRHLVGDAAAGRLYADDMAQGMVYTVDLRTDRVRRLARVDNNPNSIDLSPDGKVLFVSCRGRNGSNYYLPGPEWGSVVLIDTGSGRLLDAVVGGNQTTGLDVSPDGRTLAFSDFLDNRIHTYAIPASATLAAGHGGRVAAHRAELAK